MKKIEKRAVVCFLLALALTAGLALFLLRYVTQGGRWASSAFNRHLYNTEGVLSTGAVLDRDGDVLPGWKTGNGRIMIMRPFGRPPSTPWEICGAASEPGPSTPSPTG